MLATVSERANKTWYNLLASVSARKKQARNEEPKKIQNFDLAPTTNTERYETTHIYSH